MGMNENALSSWWGEGSGLAVGVSFFPRGGGVVQVFKINSVFQSQNC